MGQEWRVIDCNRLWNGSQWNIHNTSFRECAQCGGAIVAPEWSEHRSERCIRNVWSCEACGYRFERTVYLSAPKIQPDLRVEENEQAA